MVKKQLITVYFFFISALVWSDDVITFTGGTQSGSSLSRFVKSFGFTMPDDEGISSYQTNAITLNLKYNNSTKNSNYYLVVSKNNISNKDIPAEDIIAVSSNSFSIKNTGNSGNKTFNFSTTLKFRPNTTYYAYFATSNSAATNGFTPAYIYMELKNTNSYQPTTSMSSSADGTYTTTYNYKPTFSMDLTRKTSSDPYQDGELQTLWSSYSTNHPWRIPAIALTSRGNLVACGGFLVCDMDIGFGECHIYSKYSNDNGVTWSRANGNVALGSGISGSNDCGYGDAALVADRESDRVLVMCATGNVVYTNSTRSNPIRVARIYGTDTGDGINWESPTDMTSEIYGLNSSFAGLFFASGRICQSRVVKTGDYYRLYSAILVHYGSGSHYNYVLYSDDFGGSWKVLGGVAISSANEAKVEELPNGDLFISSRTGSGRLFNLFSFSDLGGAIGSWGSQRTLSLGSGQSCNGEILLVNAKRADGRNCILALQSMPSESQSSYYPRQKVRIYWREVSQSDLSSLSNWTSGWSANNSYQVSHSGSAYSTMIVNGARKISFFLENNYYDPSSQPRGELQHVSLPISIITNGAYTDIISEYVIPYRVSYEETISNNNSDMRFDKVSLKREDITSSDRYYTLCLPFSMNAEEVGSSGLSSVESLSEYDDVNSVVKFSDVAGGIQAFTPYAVKSSVSDGLILTGNNVLIQKDVPSLHNTTINGATFHGNLTENYNLSEGGTVNAYGYSASTGNFSKASGTARIHAFCAYLTLPGSVSAKSVAASFEGDESVTHLDGIFINEGTDRGPVYNLSGQRVGEDYKGIIIVNGKKYIRK